MKLNPILILALGWCLSTGTAQAQKDPQARKVLDQTVRTLKQGGGIQATFSGSSEGTLQLKGDRFYLQSKGIQSWFDGKTQWSYVEDSEEVNMSYPSTEELQTIHPMALLSLYKQGYHYRYDGTQTYEGQTAHVILLTPEKSPHSDLLKGQANIKQMTVYISSRFLPLYIRIEPQQGPVQEFKVTSCQIHQPLDNDVFTFDPKKFPNVEIIDLR